MGNEILRMGISGGTFDPIHIGHLIIAQEVCDYLNLSKVLFIPVGNPPHKDESRVTDAHTRLDMVKIAIQNNPRFEALDIEVNRSGYTYAVDTLVELKKRYKNAVFYYLIGADVVFDLVTWKKYEEVFELCEFVAVLRQGYNKENVATRIDELKASHNIKIQTYEIPLIGVSSTLIRDRIKANRSVKYLLPSKVEEYIAKNNLYK